MDTNPIAAAIPIRRRRHSQQFKRQVIAECGQPGVSIAAIALRNGLNANLLRRWVTQDQNNSLALDVNVSPSKTAVHNEFVPITVPGTGSVIKVQFDSAGCRATLVLPITEVKACAQLLRAVLR